MNPEEDEGKWRILNDADMEQDGKESRRTYRIEDLITLTNNNKCRRIAFIAGAITIIFMVMVIATFLWTPSNDFDDESDEVSYLVLSGTKGLTEFNLDTKNKSKLYRLDGKVSVYEIYGDEKTFIYGSNVPNIRYHSMEDIKANPSNFSPAILLEEPRLTPQDMSYDHIGNNLYVIDKLTGILVVINVRTKYYDILLTDLINPHHIDVDSHRGLIFILQQFHSILKVNMDGTSTKKIFASDAVSAMSVDHNNKMIYFLHDVDGIKSFNYEGQNVITYPVDATDIVDLAIVNDQLYWLWEHNRNVNETHHLLSCSIRNGICEDHSMHVIDPIGDLGSIKVIHSNIKKASSIVNPCQRENGGCQHLCLIAPGGKCTCACNLGWQLNPDKKTCSEVNEFILYILLGYFRGRILDVSRNNSVDVIWPTATDSNQVYSIPFDYDFSNDIVYYSNGKNISEMKLRSNWQSNSVVLEGDGNAHIQDVAFDWLTGNLYYLQNELWNGYKIIVFNVKLGAKYNKTLVNFKPKSTEDIYLLSTVDRDEVTSLTIHPKLGYVYYITKPFFQSAYFYKMTMNGTELYSHRDFINPLTDQKILAIDYDEERLYWFQEGLTTITHTNLNLSDKKELRVLISQIPKSISIHRKYIYISTSFNIWRVSKATGKPASRIAPILEDNSNRIISGMRVVSEATTLSMKKEEHPCNNNNSTNCEQFCFLYNNQAVCECRDGETLGTDGQHCQIDKNLKYTSQTA